MASTVPEALTAAGTQDVATSTRHAPHGVTLPPAAPATDPRRVWEGKRFPRSWERA